MKDVKEIRSRLLLANPDAATGEAFASIRGYARMSGKPESTIRDRSKGARKNEIVEAEILTPGGMQGARLLTEDIVTDWIVEDNPTLATGRGGDNASYQHTKWNESIVEVLRGLM